MSLSYTLFAAACVLYPCQLIRIYSDHLVHAPDDSSSFGMLFLRICFQLHTISCTVFSTLDGMCRVAFHPHNSELVIVSI